MKIIVTGGAGFIGGNFFFYIGNKDTQEKVIKFDFFYYAGKIGEIKTGEDKTDYKVGKGEIAGQRLLYTI